MTGIKGLFYSESNNQDIHKSGNQALFKANLQKFTEFYGLPGAYQFSGKGWDNFEHYCFTGWDAYAKYIVLKRDDCVYTA